MHPLTHHELINARVADLGRQRLRAPSPLDDLFQGFDQAFVPCLFRYALNGVEPKVEPGLRKRRSGRSRYPLSARSMTC